MSPELKVENGNLVFDYPEGKAPFGENRRKHSKAHMFSSVAANFIRDLRRGVSRTEGFKGKAVTALINFLPRAFAEQIVDAAASGKEGSSVTFTRDEDSGSEEYTDIKINIKSSPES